MKIGIEKAKQIIQEMLNEANISMADLPESEEEWNEFEGKEIYDEN